MNRFIWKFAIFLLPVFFYCLLAVTIDPYNYFHAEADPALLKLKERIAYPLNYRLYKLLQYENNPTGVVIMGDSRANSLNTKYFEKWLKEPVSNMAYGGGTLPEIIDTFEEVSKNRDLKWVFIGINFNLYNGYNNMNLVPEAREIKKDVFSYLTSMFCFKSTFLILKHLILPSKGGAAEMPSLNQPSISKEEFWKYQLFTSATNFYNSYSYPKGWYIELQKISTYCRVNKIKLVFFIPPTHTDLQGRVADFHLEKAEYQFKKDIEGLGELHDFDFRNDLTADKRNFTDPFHCNDSISRLVIQEMISGGSTYSRTSVR